MIAGATALTSYAALAIQTPMTLQSIRRPVTLQPTTRRTPRCRPLTASAPDAGDEQASSHATDEMCGIDEYCIYFVSGNPVKSMEVDLILAALDIRPFRVTHIDIDLPELQGDPMSIARAKAATAARRVGGAVIVEDTSLCFAALNGMPGPYIKSFFDAVGVDGLWQMVEHQPNKAAWTECALAFSAGPGAEPLLFRGRTDGRAVAPSGTDGFGWDAVFVPEGHEAPFGEMPMEVKNEISHRSRALTKFAKYCAAHKAEVLALIEDYSSTEIERINDADGLVWGVEKRLGRRSIV